MILYHGSRFVVEKPDLLHSRLKVDFGRGFYTTPILEQAGNWARKFIKKGKDAYVSKYAFDEDSFNRLKVKRFDSYSEEWLDFVFACRSGTDSSDFDVVSGGVANDRVFNTVELYFDHLIDKLEAIKRLRYEEPSWQIAFRSEAALQRLAVIVEIKL